MNSDARAAPRRNLFMAASLRVAGNTHPAKIRDLSAAGARIEVSSVPDTGSTVALVRGSLCAEAQVTWSTGDSCGLRFAQPVSVGDWMANPAVLAKKRANRAIVIGAVDAAAMPVSPAATLTQAMLLLKGVEASLARDPAMTGKHRADLRNLDLAMRSLAICVGALST